MKFVISDFKNGILHLCVGLICVLAVTFAFPSFVSAQEDEEEFVQEGLAPPEPAVDASDPVKLFLEGQQAHERGELDKALELYTKALAAYPEFPEAEYQRGMIYQAIGKWEAAETSFRKAVEFRRDWTLAMSSLGSVLIHNEKLAEAGLVLEQAIRLDGMSFPAYTSLTDLYLIDPPDTAKIRGLYARLVYLSTKANTPASIWASRASLERVIGDLAEARKSIERSLEIQPDNDRAKVEQIELALAGSDFRVATDLARKRVRQFPDSIGAKLLLSRGLALAGQRDEAIKVLEAIENPGDRTLKLLAAIRASGEIDFDALEKELEQTPDNVGVLERLCNGLRVDDPAKALKYCERAFRLERDNVGHAVGFGAALVQLRQFDRAINLLEEIKRRYPDNYTVRANLATSYFSLGAFEKAKTEYQWITSSQPKLAAGYYFLAITHDNLREYIDAMANYQQFIRLADKKQFEPELDRVRLRLPILQRQLDRGEGKK